MSKIDDIVDFAITNRYIRFCKKLEDLGFHEYQIKDITKAVCYVLPGSKEKTEKIIWREYQNRYGNE